MTATEIKKLHPESYVSIPELEWLMGKAASRRIVVEVGSFMGCSTEALRNSPATTVIAIDDWYGPRDVELTGQQRMSIWTSWLETVGRYPNVVSLRMDHKHLGQMFLNADMVFIDGAHDYDSVFRDINNARKASRSGALICGHDLSLESVRRAVKDYTEGKYNEGPGSLWYFIRD